MPDQPLPGWWPNASLAAIQRRAKLLSEIRSWFAEQAVLEVETPHASQFGNTDPHIQSLNIAVGNGGRYLRTSAEFHMKRLLASGSGDIYEIGKVYRAGESGRHHNPEFTMLEWYRLGMDQHALIDNVEQLLRRLHNDKFPGMLRLSYRQCLQHYVGVDPATASNQSLVEALINAGVDVPASETGNTDSLLDLLIATVLAQSLAADQYTCIYDYPATQASLARVDLTDPQWAVASRFEIYYGVLELANGFHELDDPSEQLARFQADNRARAVSGLAEVPIDQHLIAALEYGLPACAGVAIGLDRLLMALSPAVTRLSDVLSFDWTRA